MPKLGSQGYGQWKEGQVWKAIQRVVGQGRHHPLECKAKGLEICASEATVNGVAVSLEIPHVV